jgi:hypothetical protein
MTKLLLRYVANPPAEPSATTFAQIDAGGLVLQTQTSTSAAELNATVGGKWVSTIDSEDPTAAASPTVGRLFKPAQPSRFVASSWTPSSVVTAPSPIGGGADDTAALQAFFDARSPGDVVDLVADAVYQVNSLSFDSTYSYLEIRGNGATFNWDTVGTLETGNAATILMVGAHGIAIDGLNITGENPNPGRLGGGALGLEGRHGISIRSSSNIHVTNCDVQNVMADPIYCGVRSSSAPEELSTGIWISDSYFAWNGRMGFGLVSGVDVTCKSNEWFQIRRSCWDLEPNSVLNVTRYVAFVGNTIDEFRLYGLASVGYGGAIEHIWVMDTACGPNNGFTMLVQPPTSNDIRRGPIVCDGNIDTSAGVGSSTNPGSAYTFVECDGVTVTNCTIPVQASRFMVSVKVEDCTAVTLSGNTCPGADFELYTDGVGSNPSTE